MNKWINAFRLRTLPHAFSCIIMGSGLIYADSRINFQSSDTTYITLSDTIFVNDNRTEIVFISQEKKWYLIPVDHYYVTDISLQSAMNTIITENIPGGHELVIDNLTWWNENGLFLFNGPVLNAYTKLINEDNETIADWQWEYRHKKKKKDKTETVIKRALIEWMNDQSSALLNYKNNAIISPYRYRRSLTGWTDVIFLSDGFIVESRIGLNFPADEVDKYIRSTLGIFYKKASTHESIAIGGKDQHWYYRFNSNWQARLNAKMRFGFNRFNPDKFEYVEWWNIILINTGLTASVEYRPRYFKGFFAGIGLHENINLLPEIIPRFETGILLSIGFNLP